MRWIAWGIVVGNILSVTICIVGLAFVHSHVSSVIYGICMLLTGVSVGVRIATSQTSPERTE
jgi:hypothetical protein